MEATQVQQIVLNTLPTTLVIGKEMVKSIYGNRQVVVNYDKSQDLFNVWAFTLKGTKFLNESKINGVFIENLQSTIEGLK